MTTKTRAWLVTVESPQESHYAALKTGPHIYATWHTDEVIGLQAVLYYKNTRAHPSSDWEDAEAEPVHRLTRLLQSCTGENGWEEMGTRPDQGCRRAVAERKKKNEAALKKMRISEQEDFEVFQEEIGRLSRIEMMVRRWTLAETRQRWNIIGAFSEHSSDDNLDLNTEIARLKKLAKGDDVQKVYKFCGHNDKSHRT